MNMDHTTELKAGEVQGPWVGMKREPPKQNRGAVIKTPARS